jgi:DNA-directed RNA polymerase subunit delta
MILYCIFIIFIKKGCGCMESIFSRVSYLNGLIEGLGIDNNSKEGKVLLEMASILTAMAQEIQMLNESQEEMEEYVDAIDEDLNTLEEDLYYDEDDEESDYDEDDFGNYININCPHCDETVYIDSDICRCSEEITCPNCHKEIPLDACSE